MLLTGLSVVSRLNAPITTFARSLVSRAATRPVPPPKDNIASPQDFLKAIGRSSEKNVSIEAWEDFWRTSGPQLKEMGLSVRDRRYILWCMEKYRQGVFVKVFAHEATAKKTVRGWGPAVQNDKRIRSRRLKNKK